MPENFLRNTFKIPRPMNWGYPILFASIGTGLAIGIRGVAMSGETTYSSTSLVGYALYMPLFILLAFIAPSALLLRDKQKLDGFSQIPSNVAIGDYSGIGPLILAFLSGVPLMLIKSALHNLVVYAVLKSANPIVFPLFFCYNESDSVRSTVLEVISDTVIPGIGMCVFFYGVIWSSFKVRNYRIALLIIPVLYAIFSFNPIDFAALLIVGWWLTVVRRDAGNIWGPFSALVGCKISEMVLNETIPTVDITEVRTYSDVSVKYFYSSVPSIFVAIILFGFFFRVLNEFYITRHNSIYGDNLEASEAAIERKDKSLATVISGFNIPLILGLIGVFVIWYLILTGNRI